MISATHEGLGAPSTSKVNSIVTWAPPPDVLDPDQLGAEAQLGADRDRRGEPHLAGAVVHAHGHALDPQDLGHQRRAHRQGQVAVGDGAAEGTGLGPLGIDVDPLVVAGGVGEQVDLLLGDLDVVAVAEVLPDLVLQPSDALHGGRHGPIIIACRASARSGRRSFSPSVHPRWA